MKRIIFLFVLLPVWGMAQTQIGQKIEGDTGTDAFGTSVAISANGNIIAVGADQNNSYTGHVRVYENVSGNWIQMGDDIEGLTSYDRCGSSIALSSNGNIIAVASSSNSNSNGNSAGHVRIFENVLGTWTQIGSDIEGDYQFDYFGASIALSADGTIVAIGSRHHDGNGPNSGQVRILKNIGGSWTQIGLDIYGLQPGDGLARSLALSSDGSVLAVGANAHSTEGGPTGYSIIYKNVSDNWTQVGQIIQGIAPYSLSGNSISISSNGAIVAIGEPGYNNQTGQVRVFENISEVWVQIGSAIIGQESSNYSGQAISLSSDGSIVAIGAGGSNSNGAGAGHVRIYKNISNTWTQLGSDINGEEAFDFFGESVALSNNGETLIIGAVTQRNSDTKNGYAKIFDLSEVLSSDNFVQAHFTVYPNPVSEVLNIELDQALTLQKVVLYNNLGQQVKATDKNSIDVSSLSKGVYFVEVHTNSGKATKKVIVK